MEWEAKWVSKEFYSYPWMLYPYYLLSAASHHQRLKLFFSLQVFVVQHSRMKCSYLSSAVYSHNI